MITESIVVPFLIGLMGTGHCIGMCGGIIGALSFSSEGETRFQRLSLVISYNIGRVFSYTLLGLIAGGVGALFSSHIQPLIQIPLLRLLAATLIILLGLYLMGITRFLAPLEKIGSKVWPFIQPIGKKFIPIQKPWQGVVVGMVWGWLPCGLVYTTLTYSISLESTFYGAMVMLSFGLGTMPALLLGGLAGQSLQRILKNHQFRLLSGILMIAFGAWSMFSVLQHKHDHDAHSEPDHHHVH